MYLPAPRFNGSHMISVDFLKNDWTPAEYSLGKKSRLFQKMADAEAVFAKHHQDIDALPDACRLTLGSGIHPIPHKLSSIESRDEEVKTLTITLPLPEGLECDASNGGEKVVQRTYYSEYKEYGKKDTSQEYSSQWLDQSITLAKDFVRMLQSFQGLSRIVPAFRVPMENLCKPTAVTSQPYEEGMMRFMAGLRQYILDNKDTWNSLPQDASVSFPVDTLVSQDGKIHPTLSFTTRYGEQAAVPLESSRLNAVGWSEKMAKKLHDFLDRNYTGARMFLSLFGPDNHPEPTDSKEL